MRDAWDDMRRAKEDGYFYHRDRELLEKLARKAAAPQSPEERALENIADAASEVQHALSEVRTRQEDSS